MKKEAEKLIELLEYHNTIIVGLDFDDTIFSLSKDVDIIKRCEDVRALIKSLNETSLITICLYTVADEQSIKYKVALMKEWGIAPAYINESPVTLGNGAKPYFNILLDDKAGLPYTYEVLMDFKQYIKENGESYKI